MFPFKNEDLTVIASNIAIASNHSRIDEVWAVGAEEGCDLDRVAAIASEVAGSSRVPIDVFAQERIGRFRPGKGDGMNTAMVRAAERGFKRVHFYDADITNFDERWIDGAEEAADTGYDVVRHRFPRASTDAMITWMVTRPGLAMIFPGTVLPRLGQPLGGELLLSLTATRALASDAAVLDRSDWGIDTMITHATATLGLPMYEHNVRDGKRHALYGGLDEIRAMVLECLDAVRSLKKRPGPDTATEFSADPPAPVPDDLKRTVAYDVNRTIDLLASDWTREEEDLAATFGPEVENSLLLNKHRPNFAFMDSETWGATLGILLKEFDLDSAAWRSLAFRSWLTRVLAYTTDQALSGYDSAIEYLEGTIRSFEKKGYEDVSP